MKKTCIACQREFDGHFNAKTCSPECRKARRRGRDAGVEALPPPERLCVVCGKAFPANRNLVTCSKECLQEKRRVRWRRYWADHPEKRQEGVAKRRARRAVDKDWAQTIDRRKYQKTKADPGRLARAQAAAKQHYRKHAATIQGRRKKRLETLSDAALADLIERQRTYGREHRRRRRADPVKAAADRGAYREFKRRRNAGLLTIDAAILLREARERADGTGTGTGNGPRRRPPCLVCGAPMIGRHPSAKVCSRACQRARNKEFQRHYRARQKHLTEALSHADPHHHDRPA